jgi:WD40 repeat protein
MGHQCILVLVGKELYQFDKSMLAPERVHQFEFGAPINISYIKEHNRYYFGTYHSGGSSLPVRIFSSSNLRDWDCLYEFPMGSVRHVHGVFYQNTTGRVYVATGDNDSESRVLFTEDNFLSVKTLVSGSQAARVVSIIFDGDDAILFTDSPDTPNYVYRLPTKSRFDFGLQVSAGSLIEGPCFNVAEKKGSIYFSTVAERSFVNNDMQSVVYHMDVSGKVSRLFACTRDLKWLKKLRPYFMHPTFLITAPSFGDELFFSAVGLKKYDGSTICLIRNENVDKTLIGSES